VFAGLLIQGRWWAFMGTFWGIQVSEANAIGKIRDGRKHVLAETMTERLDNRWAQGPQSWSSARNCSFHSSPPSNPNCLIDLGPMMVTENKPSLPAQTPPCAQAAAAL